MWITGISICVNICIVCIYTKYKCYFLYYIVINKRVCSCAKHNCLLCFTRQNTLGLLCIWHDKTCMLRFVFFGQTEHDQIVLYFWCGIVCIYVQNIYVFPCLRLSIVWDCTKHIWVCVLSQQKIIMCSFLIQNTLCVV